MKKFLMLCMMVITLFTSCSSSYVHSEYKGYEYVINEGENLHRTYSFFGENAINILKDNIKEEYEESIFFVTSYDELERVTNITNKLKDILGKDIFIDYYLGLGQRSDEFDSLYALNCAYYLDSKTQPTVEGGYIEDSDKYLEVNRYFSSRRNDPYIINDYVLDIILLSKTSNRKLFDVYDVQTKVDHYENNLIVKKNKIEYLYNKKTDSYSVYKVNSENFEIENTLRNKPVDRIMHHTFYYNQKLKSIKIPSNIRKIGNSCFQGCLNLKEVIFEENSKLEVIGERAFSTTFIKEFKIPSSTKIIKDGAFGYCTNLSKVEFEKDSRVKEIGNKVFFKCLSLSSIIIPSSVEKIGDKAFYNSYVTYIYLPISVIYLGEEVFDEEQKTGLSILIDYEGEIIPSSWSTNYINERIYTINFNKKSSS